MKTLGKTLCGILALALLAPLAWAQDGVLFRYQPRKGDEFIYRKTTKMKQTQAVMDKKIVNEITNTDVSVATVQQVDAKGNVSVQGETKSLLIQMKMGAVGDYTFDSKKNDNEKGSALGGALTPLYERLSGASLTTVVSPLGKIVEVKGYKELLGDILKDNPLAAQFVAGGSEEAAKMGLAEFFPTFSDKAVRPGEKWETPFDLQLDKLGKATGKKVYFNEGEGKVGKRTTAKILANTELSFELNIEMDGAKVTGTLSITNSQGTIHLDPKTGVVVSMVNEYKLTGNLNVAVGEMNIPIGMEQSQTITMELLESLPK